MAHADLVDEGDVQLIEVTTVYAERELIKQLPGARWDPDARAWRLPVSWAACVMLRGIFGDRLTIGTKLNDWAWADRCDRVDPVTEIRTAIDRPTDWTLDELPGRSYRDFQLAGGRFLELAGDALLADPLGVGKTVQALAALRHALSITDVLPALVICPNSVKPVWFDHVRDWFPEATPFVVQGGTVQRRRIIEEAGSVTHPVVIINYESVRLLSRLAPYGSVRLARCRECDRSHGNPDLTIARCETHPKELNTFGFRTVILDEAHRIKDPHAKQTRACWSIMHGPTVRRRWALTGTPLANHPGDLWSIMHGVNRADFPSRTKFVDRFCLLSWNNFGGMEIVGINPQRRDEFFRILDPRFRRVSKEQVLPQLPSKVRIRRYVEMTPKQAKAYRELETAALTRLSDGSLLAAPNNLVVRTRMLQLASSYAEIDRGETPDDPATWRVRLAEPSPKIDDLVELLEELGDAPVAVASESRQLLELAQRRLEKLHIPVSLLVGGMSNDERANVVQRFQDGHGRVIMFTVKTGGTGITLTRTDTLVHLQRSWSMVDNIQTDGRVDRIGSEIHDSIKLIDIITQDTVEQTVLIPRLHEKFERLEEINRDRERLRAAGLLTTTAALDDEETRIIGADLGAP